MTVAANPYLQGTFAPVHEEVTVTELPVSGRVPEALNGRYLRNGPNPVSVPEPGPTTGSQVTAWSTASGCATAGPSGTATAGSGQPRWPAPWGETPRPGPVHADMDFAPNTNVIGHAGRTFAIVEAGARPYELTHELETIGPCDFGGTLDGGYTAHPKRDPLTGELYAVSYFFGWGNDVEVTIIDAGARVRSSRRVTMGGPVSVHDSAITQRYIVLLDLPVTFSMEAVASGASFPYRWQEGYRARVGLLPRDGESTDVVWHDVEPCYVFHPMNAFDEPDGDGVVLDVVRHPSMFRTQLLGPAEGAPTLERWHIDGHGSAVKEERLDDRGQEFPRVDERRVGLPHRYGYAVAVHEVDDIVGTESVLVRHDLERGTTTTRSFGRGAALGEAVFVPRADDAGESDGWLMALVYSDESGTSRCTS